MKLHGYVGSANVYKVELALRLLAIPCQRVEVPIFQGAAQTAAFRRLNPAGRVPVLELDDGDAIPESNAILWHLADGTALLPAEARARTRVLSWLCFEQSEIEPVIGSARFWILTGRAADRADELARRLAWGRRTLAALEGHLAGRAYLVGDRPSIADLAVYAYTHLAGDAGLPLADFAAISAWCQRIEALPGYVAGPAPYTADALV